MVESSFSTMKNLQQHLKKKKSQIAIKYNPTNEFEAPTSYLFSQAINSLQMLLTEKWLQLNEPTELTFECR